MKHGYPDQQGEVEVKCGIDDRGSFFIEVIDAGIPFDPTAKADPDTDENLDLRPIGGLGILLMKEFMDNIFYERKEEKNYLKVVKNLE